MLEIDAAQVWRGQTHVLHGIDLTVGEGEIVALIGANGAGKTTVLMTISGLLRPRDGAVRYRPHGGDPVDLARLAPEAIVGLGIAHCPEGRQVFASLSVRENLLIGAYLRRDRVAVAADLDRVVARFPILGERARLPAGSLSGGEQMMLAIGRALMSRPRLLLLDEPSLGLAPQIVETIFDILGDINRAGTTLLLVEQNAAMALELAHRAYVMETGRVTLSGAAADLADNPEVRRAYLGAADETMAGR
ncbi:MAG: ABC transporter ATP-binding protein [Rhodospirillaceae bacterium]|nr:ABC transporter ATP-binding protein [Rhodospirillaceae bacterium]